MTETTSTTVDTAEPDTSPVGDPDPASTTVEPESETFPREYVERLRQESAGYRTRAQRADALAERLMTATVREATAGILADPTDLPASDDLLGEDGMPDPERIRTAANALVGRKPHLADRRPRGDADQGARPPAADVDLAGILRSRAS